MTEYIEREALEVALNHRLNFLMAENGEYDHYTSGFDEAVTRVENFPAADVAPVVRRGRWIDEDGIQICSECGEEHEWEDYRAPYCDTCGAKMAEKAVKEEACQNGGN